MVVHCSAGVGRSGTFLASYYLQKYFRKKGNGTEVSIFELVRNLRE